MSPRRGAGGKRGTRPSPATTPASERRTNLTLRETLDELLTHAREVARRARDMTPDELAYAEERMEWLAEEVWRIAVSGRRA